MTNLITDRIRQDILSSVFVPGERLIEVDLAATYEVGRGAIRSALAELDAERLIERTANRGATVRRVPISEAIQLAEARQVLEGLVAGSAAAEATPSEQAELDAIGASMRAAVASQDHAKYSQLNAELHRRISEISQHQIATELVVNLRRRAAHHQFRLAFSPGRPDQSLIEHEAIIAAICAGDTEAASDAMAAHLASVIATLSKWAESTGTS